MDLDSPDIDVDRMHLQEVLDVLGEVEVVAANVESNDELEELGRLGIPGDFTLPQQALARFVFISESVSYTGHGKSVPLEAESPEHFGSLSPAEAHETLMVLKDIAESKNLVGLDGNQLRDELARYGVCSKEQIGLADAVVVRMRWDKMKDGRSKFYCGCIPGPS